MRRPRAPFGFADGAQSLLSNEERRHGAGNASVAALLRSCCAGTEGRNGLMAAELPVESVYRCIRLTVGTAFRAA